METKNLIVVDIETSGKKSYSAHILEVAGVVLDATRLEEKESFTTLVNPGEEALGSASPEAMAVNRLSIDDLRRAPCSEEAAQAFRKFLDRHDGSLHAFNNDFDLWFLSRSPWCLPSGRWGECIMLAAAKVMGPAGALAEWVDGKRKWPRLSEAAAFFGIPAGAGHRALDDARTAAKVYAEILRRRRSNQAGDPFEEEAAHLLDDGF